MVFQTSRNFGTLEPSQPRFDLGVQYLSRTLHESRCLRVQYHQFLARTVVSGDGTSHQTHDWQTQIDIELIDSRLIGSFSI